ncbi:DUF3168 domain-containing protein [Frankia sp. RB7]|nr:DUF3168 domain-containing protein [Frankia sp. RB7]
MADSALDLLSAVQAVLKANGSLTAIVGTKVYGAPPANPSYPYVLITCQSEPFAAQDIEGMKHTLRVQGFAREGKPATALAIRKIVFAALNRQEVVLNVPGLIMIEHDGLADCFPEQDGKTYQSIIEFSVTIQ